MIKAVDFDDETIPVIVSPRDCVPPPAPRNVQVGGDHYRDMPIQPFTFIHANALGFAEGAVVKYVSRWRKKGGLEDLHKARHVLDLLIEAEERNAAR